MGHHLVHVLFAGAEHDIFSTRLCDMPCKHLVQAVRLFQRAAQGVEVFLVGVPARRGCAGLSTPRLIFCQFVLVAEHRGHILRGQAKCPARWLRPGSSRMRCGRRTVPRPCRGYCRGSGHWWQSAPEVLRPGRVPKVSAPFRPSVLRPRPVKFVHNNVGRVQRGDLRQLFFRAEQELCVGV